MSQERQIQFLIIPAKQVEYAISDKGIFPIKMFPKKDIPDVLKKTRNVHQHPDDDLNMAISYPNWLQEVPDLIIEEITNGASLMKAVSYNHFRNYQLIVDEVEPEIFTDEPLYHDEY